MTNTIGIGIQNFSELGEKHNFYIDKTSFIKEWWESNDSVTLITRPRRFGKTLNMSMVEDFFSVDYAGRGDLFKGLSIWKEEKYRNLQGTYPVISLSFARVKETDFESTKRRIIELLMFQSLVQSWFDEAEDEYNHFIRALLLGNLKAMNYYMQRVTMEIFSYFDTGKGKFGDEPERFYHGFVLGLLVDLGREYIITSNRESGFGRYDVMMEPKDKTKDALILEFKVRDVTDEKSLSDTVEKALAQIEEKQYETNLIARGIPKEKIRKYGFAFEGKNVLIGA